MHHQLLECNVTRGASTLRQAQGGGGSESELVREIVISTEKPVRSGGGIARAAGAVTSHYLRNPVVMWGHNYREPPVARTTSLRVEPGTGLSAQFEFPQPGIYPLADVVRGLWDAGFINAASIGFMPLEWEMIDDPDPSAGSASTGSATASSTGDSARGLSLSKSTAREQIPVFTRWELYEFSLVAVPRDREAVRRAFDGLDVVAAARESSALDLRRILDGLRAISRSLLASA